MEQSTDEVAVDCPYFRIYKDGRIDRLVGEDFVPPSPDAETGVRSKDVVISSDTGLSARIFLPPKPDPTRKLPLVLFFHGGGFCIYSPFSSSYHDHVAAISAGANAVALSLHYRRATEHLLPTAFHDGWDALRWAGAHYGGNGPEAWLNDHADFGRIFVVGASAGATLGHHTVRQAGVEGLNGGLGVAGLATVHPYFDNGKPDKLMDNIFPTRVVSGDPMLSPGRDPALGRLGCGKVLVLVAENDFLRERGWDYYKALKESEWKGEVEIAETQGEGHCFHLRDPTSEKALALMKKLVSFLKEE